MAGHAGPRKHAGEKTPGHDDLKTQDQKHGEGRERRD